MRLLRRFVPIALLSLAAATAPTAATALPAACQTWQRVTAPLIAQTYLTSVDGVSANDVWAVGAKSYGPSVPPILHWDGHSWKGAQEDTVDAGLLDVSADAVNDAWAVGSSVLGGPVMHWDGTRWRLQQTIGSDTLYGVVAISATDVWAVGNDMHHWDGSTWSLSATSPGLLDDVAAVSSTDVWAVGYEGDRTSALAEHWDGSTWTSVPVPVPSGYTDITLNGVAAVSSDDVWATGYYGIYLNPLIEHWDGAAWNQVAVPSPSGRGLWGVSAASASDAWTIGGWRTVSMHWDGSSWTSFAYHGPTQAGLSSIVELSSTDIWAVGSYFFGTGSVPLIEHSNGPCP